MSDSPKEYDSSDKALELYIESPITNISFNEITKLPTGFKKEYIPKLLQHMAEGNSFESFAAKINVPLKFLKKWSDEYPEWQTAIEIGEAHNLKYYEDLLKEGILGKRINATLLQLKLKTAHSKIYRKDTQEDDTKTPILIKFNTGIETKDKAITIDASDVL